MTLTELARKLRPYIEKAAAGLTDADALEAVQLFPLWDASAAYTADDRVRYDGTLYRCLQAHTAQETWMPADAPSLWAKVLIPDPDTVPAWEQPDAVNAYSKGDRVIHNGKTWISLIDGNVWEPGVYGWVEA